MKKNSHVIKEIVPGSIAEELELEPGDILMQVNGQEPEDILDYHYLTNDSELTVVVRKADGEEWELEIEKDESEDLGIVFENGLLDEYRSCHNKCVFCFIDQMPPGMRDTLYFKDDDSRLSFLQGNYVTLTNMSDHDIDRIIRFHLAPINVSVHTTNPELRCRMLNNRFAGKALERIPQLYEAGIEMNGQIVLCPGFNDGEELDRTIRDLSRYIPYMQSLSVVPVGMTKYREGLCRLDPVTPEKAAEVIDIIENWQRKIFAEHGIHFVQASDEFYLLAGRELPEEERYDGYIQLENGVGMIRLQLTEAELALEARTGDDRERRVALATGKLAASGLRKIADMIRTKYPNVEIEIYPIRNDFFGEMITVAGLVTGQDLIAQLKGRDLGEELLLPIVMFRSGEEVFLDDLTRTDAERELQTKVRITRTDGESVVASILGEGELPAEPLYEGYESV